MIMHHVNVLGPFCYSGNQNILLYYQGREGSLITRATRNKEGFKMFVIQNININNCVINTFIFTIFYKLPGKPMQNNLIHYFITKTKFKNVYFKALLDNNNLH